MESRNRGVDKSQTKNNDVIAIEPSEEIINDPNWEDKVLEIEMRVAD